MVRVGGKLRPGFVAELAATLPLSAALAGLGPCHAQADEHEVRTRASQWAPVVLFIQPGDSVIWRGMSGHDTELVGGMAPARAAAWKSALGEEGFRVRFEEEGAYLYKCETHIGAGMVGAIVVGDGEPHNLAAIEAMLHEIEVGRAALRRLVARLRRELRRRSER